METARVPVIRYRVALSAEEREGLLQRLCRGRSGARLLTRARILLKADEGLSDEETAEALHVGVATVGRIRKRFVEEGLESALHERPRPGQRPKLTGREEAHLVALTCSTPPAGQARWSLRLLADKAVELGLAESLSHETVRQVLKKTHSSPGRKSNGVCPR